MRAYDSLLFSAMLYDLSCYIEILNLCTINFSNILTVSVTLLV